MGAVERLHFWIGGFRRSGIGTRAAAGRFGVAGGGSAGAEECGGAAGGEGAAAEAVGFGAGLGGELIAFFLRENQDRILLLASRLGWTAHDICETDKFWFSCRLE